MDKLDVLYIFDDAYAGIAGVSLTSLFENNPSKEIEITAYLLLVQVSIENQQRLQLLGEKYGQKIKMFDAEGILTEIVELNLPAYRGSVMTNLRLHFQQFIPDSVHRLLYLDCDTIICRSLKELVHFNMEEKLLGMTLDAYGKVLKQSAALDVSYYNAGVLLIDCDKWRTEKWQNRIDGYVRQNGANFNHPDQDIFNIVCKNEIVTMPIRFNFQTVHRIYQDNLYQRYLTDQNYYSSAEVKQAREKPVIVHMVRFLGSNPWNEKSTHPDCGLFKNYESMSQWNEQICIPAQADFLIRIERLLYKFLPARAFFPISVFAIKTILSIDKRGKY